MKFEVLISCMHQNDFEIINKSNLNDVPTLIINQTDTSEEKLSNDMNGHRRIDTNTRGLSVSRNMAISESNANICLLCDDDEIFINNLEKVILDTYKHNPSADIICFSLDCPGFTMPKRKKRLYFISALKITSWQVSFRRERIIEKNLSFDTRFGSGTPIGSGEENIFLYDAIKAGLTAIYVPIHIGKLVPSESKWFNDFSKQSFENHGKKAKRLMGPFIGGIYCIYFAFGKYKKYKNKVKISDAIYQMIKGLISDKY